METPQIDTLLTGKELFQFLVANKSEFIAAKKAEIKKTDGVGSTPELYVEKGDRVVKAGTVAEDANSVRVKFVGNTAMWMDSQDDVLLPDCWKKTLKEQKGSILHLHDHKYEVDAEVGDIINAYSQDMSLSEFGLKKAGTAQALIFESNVQKELNEKVFNKYRIKRVKQHSIGLNYVKIDLALNAPDDEEFEKPYELWKKHIDNIINKDTAEAKGYFWAVSEIKLIEVSAVLIGANRLTPTLSVKQDTDDEPVSSTQKQPFSISEAIKNTQFLKF